MSTDDRTRFLQQIPVFALRQIVSDRYPDEENEVLLISRFQTALGRKPHQARKAITRLNRQELTRLINACPEIVDAEVKDAFERYRYGSHPSFYVFLFDANLLSGENLAGFDERFERALLDDNLEFEDTESDDLPRVRDLSLMDFISLEDAPQLFEGTYRFLNRIDFIDAEQNAVSIYETMYGFFWIGAKEGYVTIHARKPEILRSLKLAIEEATAVLLTPLVISKQFKNALKFLHNDRLRSSRLHEPNPAAKRFRWLTIADPNAYQKGYGDYENAYPELRSTRYRIAVGEKETTLTVHLNRGSLSIAGRLQASEFRDWAVDSLHEVMRVVENFRSMPAQYVETIGLRKAPAMFAYAGAREKDLVLELFSDLVTLKQTGQQMLPLTPQILDLALVLNQDFVAQLSYSCPTNEDEETLHSCPFCNELAVSLSEQEGRLFLACKRSKKHWQKTLPFYPTLDCEQELLVDEDYLKRELILLPDEKLLITVAQLFNLHFADQQYDIRSETFFIRGPNIYYHSGNVLQLFVLDPRQKIVVENINQNVKNNYGHMNGVLVSSS